MKTNPSITHFIFSFALLFLVSCAEKSETNTTTTISSDANNEEITTQNIPNEKWKYDFENSVVSYVINNKTGKEIDLPSGSKISVPKNCFVDSNGKQINGDVELKFEEFLSPGSIITSQINMKYDSAGTQYDFESAGMFRVFAYHNGESVNIANDKSLRIGLKTNDNGQGFNIYYSTENGDDWNYLEESKCEKAEESVKNQTLDIPNQKDLTKPISPSAYKANGKYFDLQNYTENSLIGVVWEYAGDNKKEDPSVNVLWQSKKWSSISIVPLEGAKNGIYQITLSNNNDKFTTIARPVYKGKVLDAENQQFNEELVAFNQKMAQIKNAEKQQMSEDVMLRFVEVKNLGLFNYDRQLKYPDMIPLLASFDFGADSLKNFPISVFLVTGNGLAVVQYFPNTYNQFRFSPIDKNKMIAILPNQEICTFTPKRFRDEAPNKATSNPEKFTFIMKKTGVIAKTAKNIDQILKSM